MLVTDLRFGVGFHARPRRSPDVEEDHCSGVDHLERRSTARCAGQLHRPAVRHQLPDRPTSRSLRAMSLGRPRCLAGRPFVAAHVDPAAQSSVSRRPRCRSLSRRREDRILSIRRRERAASLSAMSAGGRSTIKISQKGAIF